MEKRYLPIMLSDGSWIDRPDLYLLARMSYEDTQPQTLVDQLYQFTRNADSTVEALNVLEADVVKRHFARNARLRMLAGSVVLELVRIAATTRTAPSASQGFRLTAFNAHQHEKKKASIDSLVREVRKAFSEYRATAHFQAAQVANDPGFPLVEASELRLRDFLARARGFEQFLDGIAATGNFKWSPWRVPQSIVPSIWISVRQLSESESAAASGKLPSV